MFHPRQFFSGEMQLISALLNSSLLLRNTKRIKTYQNFCTVGAKCAGMIGFARRPFVEAGV